MFLIFTTNQVVLDGGFAFSAFSAAIN